MARSKRANGAGSVYPEHGSYYGRRLTDDGGHANRRLGRVRRPGTRQELTRAHAERCLREPMQTIHVTTDPDRTVAPAGEALLAHLEATGCARSHRETVEAHSRVHLVPFSKVKSLDRIQEPHVTRLLRQAREISSINRWPLRPAPGHGRRPDDLPVT